MHTEEVCEHKVCQRATTTKRTTCHAHGQTTTCVRGLQNGRYRTTIAFPASRFRTNRDRSDVRAPKTLQRVDCRKDRLRWDARPPLHKAYRPRSKLNVLEHLEWIRTLKTERETVATRKGHRTSAGRNFEATRIMARKDETKATRVCPHRVWKTSAVRESSRNCVKGPRGMTIVRCNRLFNYYKNAQY